MFGSLDDLLDQIHDAPDGAHVAAFFDFDNTLISGYSVEAFSREQLLRGDITAKDLQEQTAATFKYAAGKLSFSGLMAENAKSLRGQTEAKFQEFGEQVFKKRVAGSIFAETHRILRAHRDKGHTIAIVSSATPYQIEPAARELDIDHVLCTELVVEDGVFTGEVVSPTCWGEGKRTSAEAFCDAHGTELAESFFYTDSHDDLPLLDVVGRPRIVNPSTKLERVGRRRHWPMYKFKSRGRPTLSQIARTGMMYGAMSSSMAASLPIWALTGRKRDALNSAYGLWSDYSAAVTGLNVRVEGEGNAWAQRPAVFVFNHQSAMDSVIVAKVVKKDFTGIGKKEIANLPMLDQVYKLADVVLIDRANTKKAIEAMEPAVKAMRDDGLSVIIAPEGTRSAARKLGRFKKGAFHLAMQAGVPVVPIVIHNAADSMPKGHVVARAADIDVTVLPPIDTSSWSADTIDSHVALVRGQFLEALGQAEADEATG